MPVTIQCKNYCENKYFDDQIKDNSTLQDALNAHDNIHILINKGARLDASINLRQPWCMVTKTYTFTYNYIKFFNEGIISLVINDYNGYYHPEKVVYEIDYETAISKTKEFYKRYG